MVFGSGFVLVTIIVVGSVIVFISCYVDVLVIVVGSVSVVVTFMVVGSYIVVCSCFVVI